MDGNSLGTGAGGEYRAGGYIKTITAIPQGSFPDAGKSNGSGDVDKDSGCT